LTGIIKELQFQLYPSMIQKIKELIISIGLKIIQVLVRIKPVTLRLIKALFLPTIFMVRGVILLLVPLYKFVYGIKRQLAHIYNPAKNRFMFWITNRYIVHVLLISIVAITVVLNVNTDPVRAETFGQKSLMYKLVTDQAGQLVEEYIDFEEGTLRASYRYQDQTAVTSGTLGIDPTAIDIIGTSLMGGSSIATTPMSTSLGSVADREEILSYSVQSGDTLSSIASEFNISLNTLLWANDLTVKSTLSLGKELTIPPVSGVIHTVKSGDTLLSIANKYDAEAEEIITFNQLTDSSDLRISDVLIVPNGMITIAPVAVRENVSNILTSPRRSETSTIAPAQTGSGSMVWPTDLHVITQYKSWSHTGLDIDCHFVHDNYAADDGVVQYIGWKGGYGNTVEINHGNGIVTRYGHHASMYVSPGQQISKGTAIGRCGTTGKSTGTHLHFEVIVGGVFKNPLDYIR